MGTRIPEAPALSGDVEALKAQLRQLLGEQAREINRTLPQDQAQAFSNFLALMEIGAALPSTLETPMFSAHLDGTNQTGVVTTTWTKVAWDTVDFDPTNDFDIVTNNRFIPSREGIYHFDWSLLLTVGAAGTTLMSALYKNGSAFKRGSQRDFHDTTGGTTMGSALAEANGSTDYFEIFILQTTGSNKIINGAAIASHFHGNFVGEL